MPVITEAGENTLAEKQASSERLIIDRVVLANIPALIEGTETRLEALPDQSETVFTGAVSRVGYVNPNLVVYSITLDSTIGNFSFNWFGLVTSDGVLFAVHFLPLVEKRRTQNQQTGNNITRNFMIEFSGASESTGINVSADTWQIDFTTRLSGIDERERQSNYDLYGNELFFNTGFQVRTFSEQFQMLPGVGYVYGIRIEITEPVQINIPSSPNQVYLDVSLQGSVLGIEAVVSSIVSSDILANYIDSEGITHYVVEIARFNDIENITDSRTVYNHAVLSNLSLNTHNHDENYVLLTRLRNEINLDSPNTVATSRAVKRANDQALLAMNNALWTGIRNKPLLFPPALHNHDARYIQQSARSNAIDSDSQTNVATSNALNLLRQALLSQLGPQAVILQNPVNITTLSGQVPIDWTNQQVNILRRNNAVAVQIKVSISIIRVAGPRQSGNEAARCYIRAVGSGQRKKDASQVAFATIWDDSANESSSDTGMITVPVNENGEFQYSTDISGNPSNVIMSVSMSMYYTHPQFV